MKPRVAASCFFTYRFLWISSFIAISLTANAQPPTRTIDPKLYRTLIRPDTRYKIQTVEQGRVQKTDSTALTEFKIPVHKKAVISLKNTTLADKKSINDFKATLKLPYNKNNVEVLPELHIESGEGLTEDKAYGIVFTLQQPLHYDDNLKKFSATLGFLLASELDNNYKPIEPVKIEVISNDASSIEPRHLNIDHLGLESSDVTIIADHVADSAKIKVITTSNTGGYITYLKVRPLLEISSNQSRLQGFGIQEIPVTVRFKGSNSSDSVTVNFSTEKGTVSPNSISVKYNEPQTVYLRSEGVGSSKLSARTSNTESNTLAFRFVFPWLFLLAALLGGLTGSLAKYFFSKDEKVSAVKPIIGGILIGIIGAAAWFGLGINLLGVSLSPALNAFAVFTLSALCAYFGISLIKMDGKS